MKCRESECFTRTWSRWRNVLKDDPERQIDNQIIRQTGLSVYWNTARRFGPFFWPYQAIS